MDPVRFGRVLGVGARLAGRTLAQAVDAATAPKPGAEPGKGDGQGVVLPPVVRETGRRAGQQVHGVRRGGRRFGEAVWGPFTRASGVLWLEVTGVFFGLIALSGLEGMWMSRGALHWAAAGQEAHRHFMLAGAIVVVFGYFCVSSFARAARRERRGSEQ